MYRYVLFDLDGTLTDSKPGIFSALRSMLATYGKELPDEVLTHFIGPPIRQSLKTYCGMDEQTQIEATYRFRHYYNAIGIYENTLLPGVVTMLRTLQDKGILLALATSKPQEAAELVLDRFSLTGFFKVISGAVSDGKGGEKSAVVRTALKKLGVVEQQKRAVLMVGDRKFDVIGAAENGVQTAGFTAAGYAEEGELESAGAIFVTDRTELLTKFVLGE